MLARSNLTYGILGSGVCCCHDAMAERGKERMGRLVR